MNCTIDKNRIEWIDTARGLGILFIIIGHIGPKILSGWLYSFHVPLFFCISGVCFNPRKTYKEFILRKLNSMIVPYLFLGTVAILFQFLFYSYDSEWIANAFHDFLIQEKYMTIWFLACLFIAENIFYFILKIRSLLLITTISLGLFIAGAIYYRLGGGNLPWCIDSACMAVPFIFAGHFGKNVINNYIVNKSLKEIYKSIIFIIAGGGQILLWYTNRYYFGYQFAMYNNQYLQEYLTLPAAILGVLCTIYISNKIHSKPLQYIGKNSLVYFAWHQVIFFPISDIIVYDWISHVISSKLCLYLLYISAIVILCTFANIMTTKSPLRIFLGYKSLKNDYNMK